MVTLCMMVLDFMFYFKVLHSHEVLIFQIEYGETDAWLSLELMFHLSVLPLTRQLTNISGNLWGRSLQVTPIGIFHSTI